MTTIGTFKTNGKEFAAAIATLAIRANIRIAPVQRMTDAGPSRRIFAGDVEAGAAWSRRSRDGKPYLSVRLDDPTLIGPVYASLMADENGKGHSLLWSRGGSAASSDRRRRPHRRAPTRTRSAAQHRFPDRRKKPQFL